MPQNRNIEILDFLSELNKNNNKNWFDVNREKYKSLREFFISQTTEIIGKIAKFDNTILFEDPKKCIFRINRDIRFSHDKSPYKTNFGMYIVPGGKKSGNAGYYLHLDPAGSFIAGGIHNPQSLELKKLRWYIFENINSFIKIIEAPDFKNNFVELKGEKLKNPPKDFDKNFEHIEYLKFKAFTVIHPIDIKFIQNDKFIDKTVEIFEAMFPFINYLNKALK